jgi:uncharacterized membrane protein
MNLPNLELTGIFLVLAGVFVLIASIFLQRKSHGKANSESGGFILLGPIPIAFGSFKSKDSLKILQLAAVGIVVVYAIWLFFFRK